MATVPGPPGMQPWIREMERRVSATERGVRAATQVTGRSERLTAYAESLDAITTAPGVVPEWAVLLTSDAPSIRGEGNGQRVKITVTAVCEGWRPGTAAGAASALMRATFQPADAYRKGTRADDLAGVGLGFSFDYPAGSAATQRFSGSFSRVMNLPIGPYTVRSEYLYTQSVAGIAVRWSQRTLMIEPF